MQIFIVNQLGIWNLNEYKKIGKMLIKNKNNNQINSKVPRKEKFKK